MITDPHGAVVAMHRIQAAGVQLAIDDFGASGALLTSLKRLPVDEIKLAGAFVRDMVRDARDAAIVRCTIDLGHSLGRRVVAQDVADAAPGRCWPSSAATTRRAPTWGRPWRSRT